MYYKSKSRDYNGAAVIAEATLETMISWVKKEMDENPMIPFFATNSGNTIVVGLRDLQEEHSPGKLPSYDIIICRNGFSEESYIWKK